MRAPKNTPIDALMTAGISYADATALRRISMTLQRWHELECGNSNDWSSWAITRGDTDKHGDFIYDDDGRSYLEEHSHREGYGWRVWCRDDVQADGTPGDMVRATRKRFASKESALEYMQSIAPTREPELRQIWTRYVKIADRERGALKRLRATMARYPSFGFYIQSDPRGCALYILRPGDVPEGATPDSCYNRGIAVYK